MYIQVKLLRGFQEPLLYQVPETWPQQELVGSVVSVPIRTQIAPAIVLKTFDYKPKTPFAIKQALEIEAFPKDKHYNTFIKKLSAYYQINYLHFIKRIRQFLVQKEVKERASKISEKAEAAKEVTLTDEQQKVWHQELPGSCVLLREGED